MKYILTLICLLVAGSLTAQIDLNQKLKQQSLKLENRQPAGEITVSPKSGNSSNVVVPGAKVAPANAGTYAGFIDPIGYAAHLEFLSSDVLEGRETAEMGQKVAAHYLAAQFKRLGLKPGNGDSFFQEYELTRTRVNGLEATLDGKNRGQLFKDFLIFDGAPFKDPLAMDYVFAGFGIQSDQYDNLKGLSLEGKAALVLPGEPMKNGKSIFSTGDDYEGTYDMRTKARTLEKAGAGAVVMVMEDKLFNQLRMNPWMKHRMEGYSLSLTHLQESGIPFLAISESKANEILKKSKKSVAVLQKELSGSDQVPALKWGKARLLTFPEVESEIVIAENVLGLIEGTDKKDEIVVLTAHYDHLGVRDGEVFNGADDDGTGTTALIEIAEAFAEAAKNGHRPRRSILIMPVSGEEKGLLGSRYYTDFPVYPLANTVCNLNIDMIGRIDDNHEDGNYIYVIGSDMLSTDLHKANEKANRDLTRIDLDYRYNNTDDPNRYYYRSDHYNFAKNDIPCIFYFSGVHADYHQSTDTFEKIDIEKATRITRLVFATAWEVANRDKRLVVDKKEK